MSQSYPQFSKTNFPNSLDQYIVFTDVTASNKQYVDLYYSYFNASNFTAAAENAANAAVGAATESAKSETIAKDASAQAAAAHDIILQTTLTAEQQLAARVNIGAQKQLWETTAGYIATCTETVTDIPSDALSALRSLTTLDGTNNIWWMAAPCSRGYRSSTGRICKSM